MKRIAMILLSALTLTGMTVSAQHDYNKEDKSKRPSPPATAKGNINNADIIIDYSSPSVKGRTVYGELEAFGKIWRAGANEATTFETSKDIKVNGKTLAAGKYSFFVIPKESGPWTVIFNTVAKQWGAYKHDESKDALRVEANTSEIEHVEKLKYTIADDGMVHLDWSTTRLSFSIQ